MPAFVMEVLSPSTQRRDLGFKWDIYRWMGMGEYRLYDPDGDGIEGHLEGYRRRPGGEFEAIRETAPGSGEYWSEALGLRLRNEGGNLRFHDPHTGQDLPSSEESVLARKAAEARVAELEARLRRHSAPE